MDGLTIAVKLKEDVSSEITLRNCARCTLDEFKYMSRRQQGGLYLRGSVKRKSNWKRASMRSHR